MTIVLDNPNEIFTNSTSAVDTLAIVRASSSNNVVTNGGVMWATGASTDAVIVSEQSVNATISNSATGYIRGTHTAINFFGSSGIINNAGEMTGDEFGVRVGPPGDSEVTVNNVFGGTIKSGGIGIHLFAGNTGQINNDGIVYGGNAGVALSAATLTNSGEVGGNSYGIQCFGFTTIVNTNFGIISSSGTAIEVSGEQATITNGTACLITGLQAAIRTVDGAASEDNLISLTNLGKIDGKIDCNATVGVVNDAILNKGTINGDVFLGAGDDSFNGLGGTSGKVFGEAGSDTLTGSAAGDYLNGGGGVDTLRGGLGKDQMFGGADRDLFDFNSIKESVRGGKRDSILDFKRGQDDIDLSTIDAKTGGGNQAFKFIGKQGFHDQKGELRYKDLGSKVIVQGDVNGDGKADFEIFVAAGALSKGDFLL